MADTGHDELTPSVATPASREVEGVVPAASQGSDSPSDLLTVKVAAVALVASCFVSSESPLGFGIVRALIGAIGFFFMGVLSALVPSTVKSTTTPFAAATIGILVLAIVYIVAMHG
jgi:hypothetical protein